MKLRRKVLVLALAMSMMLAMPISGSADVGESSVQEVMNKEIQLEDGKVFYLKLSNPNLCMRLLMTLQHGMVNTTKTEKLVS